MKYSIEISSTEKCHFCMHVGSEPTTCLYAAPYKCVGLGNEGCPFKPGEEQSCETCGHKYCYRLVPDESGQHYVTHCNAYIREVK